MKKRSSLSAHNRISSSRTTRKNPPLRSPKTPAAESPAEALLLPERPSEPDMLPVSISLFDPEARTVFVAGTFNDWKRDATPLQKRGEGHWAIELLLSPGRHEYRFVVDGIWRDDPLSNRYIANPFGGLNAVIEV